MSHAESVVESVVGSVVESIVVSPRDVLCVLDHAGRDLRVADQARRGRFTHNEVTLDLGRRPDWHNGGCDDEEWRIEWVKLYEGLDLAHAFAITGERSYLATWEDLVDSFCAQVPVGHDSSDVSARRVLNWIYAWCRFADSAGFVGLREGLPAQLCERLARDIAHIRDHLTPERNHRTLELYAVFVAALALPQIDPAGDLADELLALLEANLLRDVWPDGVHRECSTDYHHIVLRSFVGVIGNAARFGLQVSTQFVERVSRACDFALHVQRPDGTTPSLSDGDVGHFGDLLALAGDLLERPDLTWVATRGVRGTPPQQNDATFALGGYATQRSGWGRGSTAYGDERFLVLDCGPLGDGGHGHYDQLSVEMAGGGASIVVDPGRYTYADDPDGWRHWFKGTAAHNTVVVDGLDQVPFRRGKPVPPHPTARLVDRHSSPDLDLITAEATSPRHGVTHTRRIAFVGREYWIVHDVLHDEQAHWYDARWHLPSDAAIDVVVSGSSTIIRTGAATFVVPRRSGEVRLEDGWVSPEYGVKFAAPVVSVRTYAAHADMITVVVPGDGPVHVDAAVESLTGALHARVVQGDGRQIDTIVWSPGPRHVASWTRTTQSASGSRSVRMEVP